MPIRSITVKLIVSRKPEQLQQACDLWQTHYAINRATAFYESALLEMRGREYVSEGAITRPTDAVIASLDGRIAAARIQNGKNEPLIGNELLEARSMLRKLYEAIVPSSIGEKGDAQQANAFIGPLSDPASTGFMSVFEKIGSAPSWVEGVRSGNEKAFIEANKWAESPEGRERLQATGAPPTWARKYRKGEQDWPSAFVVDYDRKCSEAVGVPTLVKTLKEMGVLPLFNPFLTPKISDARSTLSRWDRLAFRLAVGHLLSWESWCTITSKDHYKRQEQVESFRATYLQRPELAPALQALNRYEQERSQELGETSLAPVKPFRIRMRMIRRWPELRERWLRSKNNGKDALMALSAMEQTKMRGAFGDPHLFAWLAEPDNHNVWSIDSDAVTLLAKYNALLTLLERSRQYATMTLPDAVTHPRSVQWEPAGGSNLKNYQLVSNNGEMKVTLPLLHSNGNDSFSEVSHTFSVAPTSQFQRALLMTEGNSISLSFENQTGELLSGKLNSADLLFDWDYTRFRKLESLSAGDIGPAFLKVVADISHKLPDGWDGKLPKAVIHFTSAIGNEKKADSVQDGLRILSVDMGLRSFAACSVFELKSDAPPQGKLSYQIEANGSVFWAVHERSFVLHLPDENQDSKGAKWRAETSAELRKFRGALNRYRALYRLEGIHNKPERDESLAEMLLNASDNGWSFEKGLLDELAKKTGLPQEQWNDLITGTSKSFRYEFGMIVKEWRRRTRMRSRNKAIGKSMWAVEHFTNLRRFLVSWSLLGKNSADIRRLDRAGKGIFAARLLKHLDGIKDDRLKTGSDLIVQAARGFLRDEQGRWQEKYAPCHAVLFEDLSRYRMKTDRPRRENSQLMLWAHRQIPEEVKMQGEIYGISVCSTGAAFSSRFHAGSNAPGIRCHQLTDEDLSNQYFVKVIEQENLNFGICLEKLRAGDIIPLSGGEIFVSLTSNAINRIHADINAAQNLQRRFWTRHGEPFRIACRKLKINDQEVWLPHRLGKRLLGGLGGYGMLVPTGHESGSCRWEVLPQKQWRKYGGEIKEDEPIDIEYVDVEEITEDILETTGEVVVFFRDPSGFLLPKELWFPAKNFWSIVKSKTVKAIICR